MSTPSPQSTPTQQPQPPPQQAQPPPPQRTFPSPCWTYEETVALIHAYRDKWYALRRKNLRSTDWDDVASTVSLHCPTAATPKSSLQCRHKMEKLRKRYRTEKQRSLSFPGRFFTSWNLFYMMDALENGTPFPDLNDQTQFRRDKVESFEDGLKGGFGNLGDLVDGYAEKQLIDRNNIVLGLKAENFGKNSAGKVDIDGFGLREELGGGGGGARHGGGFNEGNRKEGKFYGSVVGKDDFDVDRVLEEEFVLKSRRRGVGLGDVGGGGWINDVDSSFSGDSVGGTRGSFPVRSLGDRSMMPPGIRPKKISRTEGSPYSNYGYEREKSNGSGRCGFGGDLDRFDSGFMPKDRGQFDMRSGVNINNTGLGSGSAKRDRSARVGRDVDPMDEMVASIRLLGEEFVKVEKMKMEMTREIETMRMKMEMKRQEMILKSQQMIVNAFLEGLRENNKSMEMPSEP